MKQVLTQQRYTICLPWRTISKPPPRQRSVLGRSDYFSVKFDLATGRTNRLYVSLFLVFDVRC
jgi:hypothetical protein